MFECHRLNSQLEMFTSLFPAMPDYPLEARDTIQKKYLLLPFLSRISEGESLGKTNFNAFITGQC